MSEVYQAKYTDSGESEGHPIPGQENMGYGVNIFDRKNDFASPSTLQKRIIDFSSNTGTNEIPLARTEGGVQVFRATYLANSCFDVLPFDENVQIKVNTDQASDISKKFSSQVDEGSLWSV